MNRNRKKRVLTGVLLACALMLSGCNLQENLSQLPEQLSQLFPKAGNAEQSQPAQQTDLTEAQQGAAIVVSDAKHGMLIHLDRSSREAYDPASGSQRILLFAWDSVRAESDRYPEAAQRITEEMALLQDVWYTGSGSASGDIYGYNTMLEAAEDRYALAQQFGGQAECTATRYITVLRADESVCAFQVVTSIDLGENQRSSTTETLAFDARTGAPLEGGLPDEPQRQDAVKGSVRLLPLADVKEGSIEIVDQVVIGEGGEALLLAAEGEVRDFALYSVVFSDRLYQDAQLFYCDTLRNCAVQLALLQPGDLPNTMLRYRDASGMHEYLISQSGKDGSFLLTESSVFLVQ